jgi:hypothetical protein
VGVVRRCRGREWMGLGGERCVVVVWVWSGMWKWVLKFGRIPRTSFTDGPLKM